MADQKTTTPESISSSVLLGSEVKNHDGESLGQVEEILVRLKDGQVTSFIMLTQDEEGAGKRIAVPWDMVDVKSQGEISLGIQSEFLQRIPEYSGDT